MSAGLSDELRTRMEGVGRRYVDLVYGAAERQLGGQGARAQDVTQAVFLLVLRKAKAGGLPEEGRMAGWLLKATGYAVKEIRRRESTRARCEAHAAAAARESECVSPEIAIPGLGEEELAEVRRMLDGALLKLGALDREVVVRRYLRGEAVGEVAAAVGLSENTAGRRIARALEKLRKMLGPRGTVVPAAGVMAVLLAEGAKTAPAAVAASVAAGPAGAGAAAVSIAKGAALMMKFAVLKVAAAGILAVLVLLGTGVLVLKQVKGQTVATAAAPTVSSPRPGNQRPMMARWDIVMNQQGVGELKKVVAAIKTESMGYEAYEGDAGQVHGAVKTALLANDVLLLPWEMSWSDKNENGSAWARREKVADAPLGMHGQLAGTVWLDKKLGIGADVNAGLMAGAVFTDMRKDAVRLRIDPRDFQSVVLITDGTKLGVGKMHVEFQGDVGVGNVVVFAGKWGESHGVELWHVSIWETFDCADEQWKYVKQMQPRQWVEEGLATGKKNADRAIAWNSNATHEAAAVESKWERKLPNGGVARLVAVGEPMAWPDCWWDAQGKPVAMDPGLGAMSTLGPHANDRIWAVVQLDDPSMVVKTVDGSQVDETRSMALCMLGKDGNVEAGVGAGAWKDGGAIKMGETVEAAGVKVTLTKVAPANAKTWISPGSSWIESEQTTTPDVEVRIAAFDKGGREVSRPKQANIQFGRAASSYAPDFMQGASGIVDAAPEEIASFKVQWRRRSWTTFEGFATKPVISPDHITPHTAMTKSAEKTVDAGTPEAVAIAAPAAKLPFTISRETTGITEPLHADGTPDYVKALNDQYGKGVTPDNNGFVVWMQVVGSNVLPEESRKHIFALTGANPPANGEGVEGPLAYTGVPAPGFPIDRDKSLPARLWKAEEFPEFADFLKGHAKALALATEASQKPRWWLPAVSPDGTLTRIWYPNRRLVRVARILCGRATLRAQAGDFDGFLSDVMAVKRLARLTMDWSEISHISGAMCEEEADRAIGVVAGSGILSAQQCVTLAKALDGLEPLPPMLEVVDTYSRWSNMESIANLALGKIGRALGPMEIDDDQGRSFGSAGATVRREAVDWDAALKVANARADETLAILKRPLMKDEMEGRDAFMRKISEIIARPRQDMVKKAGETTQAYSVRVSEFISLGIAPWEHERQHREAVLQAAMMRVVIAAAQYHADKGRWPVTLDNLLPGYLKAVPADIYSKDGKLQVRYLVVTGGIRIYSVGPNQVDDGGMLDVEKHLDDIAVGILAW